MRCRRSCALCVGLLLLAAFATDVLAASALPSPTGPVTDLVGVLDQRARQQLSGILDRVRERTGAEVAILVVPSTAPDTIDEYSIAIFDQWKIGQKGKDNGLLFLVAVQDRRMRITTGYGLEAILPDGKVGAIRDRAIIPLFRAGRYADGIMRGTEALADVLLGEGGGSTQGRHGSPAWSARAPGSRWTGALLALFVVLILFSVAVSAADRRTAAGGRGLRSRPSRWWPWFFGGGLGSGYGGWSAGRYGTRSSGGFGGGLAAAGSVDLEEADREEAGQAARGREGSRGEEAKEAPRCGQSCRTGNRQLRTLTRQRRTSDL